MVFNSHADEVAAKLAREIEKQKAASVQSPANPFRLLLKRSEPAPIAQKVVRAPAPGRGRPEPSATLQPSYNVTVQDESLDATRFKKLPPATKDRRSGRFVKRARGDPFELVTVLMPPAVINRVLGLAESQGLAAATIWRRAVILGLNTAEAELANGADLSRE